MLATGKRYYMLVGQGKFTLNLAPAPISYRLYSYWLRLFGQQNLVDHIDHTIRLHLSTWYFLYMLSE